MQILCKVAINLAVQEKKKTLMAILLKTIESKSKMNLNKLSKDNKILLSNKLSTSNLMIIS